MKKLFLCVLFLLSVFIPGCISNKLIEINNGSDCLTSLEGNCFFPQVYKHFAPSVVFPPSNKLRYQGGDVLRYDSTGVLFLTKKNGLFDSRDTVFFRYDEITAIVDSQNFVIWGKIAERDKKKISITFSLVNQDIVDYQPLEIQLNGETHFAYCAYPGNYYISNILVKFDDHDYCNAYKGPIVKFTIEKNRVNYLGDFTFLDSDTNKTANLVIPYRRADANIVYVPYSPDAGLFGVAASALIYATTVALTKAAQPDVYPVFRFNITHDTQFKPYSKSTVTNTVLMTPF